MRKINKDFNTIPAVLLQKGTQIRKRALLQIEHAINTQKGNQYTSYQSVYQNLKSLYHNKCAYCEEKVIKERELANGEISERKKDATIDHYRPKDAGYYWLGNEWSNLLFACAICNEAIKKTKFPISRTNKAVIPTSIAIFDSAGNFDRAHFTSNTSIFRADKPFLLEELPLLLHPEIDNPVEHLIFDSWGRIRSLTERGAETIKTLELNRFDDDRNAILHEIIILIEVLHKELFEHEIGIDKYNKDLQKLFCIHILSNQSIDKEFSFWYQYLSQHFEDCILMVLERKDYFSAQEIFHIKTIFEECKVVVTAKMSL